ncbi:restriction endonuclease subunit S [Shewanella frigidimarina]|uniref:restriction endonuclease subunit S n=1 Tax=Shewanella frigidimarina TaxID=56812 RepID=UPI003D799D9A
MADLSILTNDGQSEQAAESLITKHIDIWTTAIERKSSAGRGTSNKFSLYGIKKLRELILELAVRGKLVPQDVNDESASVLLDRIAAEKAQLVKDGKLKKQKPLPEISDDEKPFELPQGWEWSYIQQIGHDWGQKTPDSEFLYIDVGSINKELGFIEEPSLLDSKDAPSRARKIVKKGTVIYSTVRPYLLNIAVIDKDFSPEPIASTAFAIIHPFDGISATYIYRYFRSPTFITYVESVQNGIAYPAINDRQFFTGLIAIPPMEEQHRIVAKVDELMSLCDALEAQTEASITAHQTLVETLLNALLLPNTTQPADSQSASPEPSLNDSFIDNWQRVAEHFDTLFTTEASIDTLKQTILQLAVMGKLVEQDENDEPTAKLLERIAAEKTQLIKDGKIKKQKPLPAISDEEKPFELPEGWEWCRFDNLIDQQFPISYGVLVPGNDVEKGVPFVRIGDIKINAPSYLPEKSISQEIDSKYERTRLLGGEILMAVVGSIGKLGVVPMSWKGANIARALCRIKPWELMSKQYVLILLQSRYMQESFMGDTRTLAQPTLNIGLIRASLTPVPPLEEQHRIVSKVDELMALCDQLKARLSDAQTTQLHLTDAIVEQAM